MARSVRNARKVRIARKARIVKMVRIAMIGPDKSNSELGFAQFSLYYCIRIPMVVLYF